MIAYRVSVSLLNLNSTITKSIWRVKVLKLTEKYATIDDYGTEVKVDRADICDTDETAVMECERRAVLLASKLKQQLEIRLAELKAPAYKANRVPSEPIPIEAFDAAMRDIRKEITQQ